MNEAWMSRTLNPPLGWCSMTIGELHAGDVPSLTPPDFQEESFLHFSIPSYQDAENPAIEKGRDILSTKLAIPQHCVLFGKLNPRVRKVWNVHTDSPLRLVASTEWLPIVVVDSVDQDFVYYLMWSDWVMPLAQSLVSGSTPSRQRVNPEAFYSIEVPVPPLEEQRAIGRVLGQIRDATKVQDRSVALAQDLKQAAMQTLFTRGLRGEAQKETEIGPVPESWEVTNLGSVRDQLQYGTSVKCTYKSSKYPVVRIPNIEPQKINLDDLKYCELSDEQAERFRLENGDLLFIRTNGVLDRLGSCAIYSGKPADALFASYLIRARLKQDYITPEFASYFLGSDFGTALVAGRATPASDGKYNLNTAAIDSLLLPLPSLDEQHEIAAILDAIDRKIDLHRRKRAVLEELFKALLHKLMAGEIQVGELDLEPLARVTCHPDDGRATLGFNS